MDASFIPVEVVPSKTPFGLDQLRRSYKSALSATAAIAAAPVVGTADEAFPNMFLMPVSTPESAESATRIELVYMGCFLGAGGTPTLPAVKHSSNDAVASSSSSINVVCQAVNAISITFYQPINTISYFSFGGPGTTEADDPVADIRIITYTINDVLVAAEEFTTWIPNFFQIAYQTSFNSEEIVPGKYWQNTSTKIKTYMPITPVC